MIDWISVAAGFFGGLAVGIIVALIVNHTWGRYAARLLRYQERELRDQIYSAYDEGKEYQRRFGGRL